MNYDIAKEDVIPLVFDTYGGYASGTLMFIRKIADSIADNDEVFAAEIKKRIRDAVAVAIANSQGKIAEIFNTLNERYWNPSTAESRESWVEEN